MKKKVLALILAMAMCLSLAACGSASSSTAEETGSSSGTAAETEEASEAEDTQQDEAPAEEAPAEEAPAEEAPAEEAPAEAGAAPEAAACETASDHQYNFPNSDIALLDYTNEYSLPLCEETETISWMRNGLNLMGDLANLGLNEFQDMEYIQYLQEITNVNIEFIELEFFTSQEMMGLYIASGDYADIISDLSYNGDAAGALSDEVIIDLTDYLEDYAPNYNYLIHSNEDFTKIFEVDGKILSFMSPYENFINNQGLVVRTDWLEEQGFDIPTTYDELTEVLLAFKSAYNCETPIYFHQDCMITGLVNGYDVQAYSAGGNATSLPYYVVDGVVHCSLLEDNYKAYLQEMNMWYSEGLIDPDFISIENDPFSSYLSGQITSDQMGVWTTSGEGIDNYDVPISCLPAPTANDDGMDHITSVSLVTDSSDTYITSCCDNIEVAMRLVDYFYSEDGILFYNYGFEDVDYTIDENGTPQFTDAVVNNEFGLSPANYMRIRCGYGVFSSLMLRYRSAAYNTDINNEAWDVWSSNVDGAMAIPSAVSMDTEETETSSYYSTDICTYADQMIPQFILGDVSFDEWDSFVDTLISMNIETCIAAEQSAYDRYMSQD